MKTTKKTYEPPVTKTYSVAVENGFAISYGNITLEPIVNGGSIGPDEFI